MSARTHSYELHIVDVDGTRDRRLTDQPPTEWTAVLGAHGPLAGLRHLRTFGYLGPLASEYALRKQFESLADEALPDWLDVAATYRAWYPKSSHAQRAWLRVRAATAHTTPREGAPAPVRDAPPWADVIAWKADPRIVTDAGMRTRIDEVALPWRVRHRASGIEMLLVPAGEYVRGAAPDDPYDRANERPAHRVVISRSFYLGRYEVTNAQVRRWGPDHDSGSFYRAPQITLDGDDMPAVDISWHDARAFAQAHELRLPTEAEWEYAARAGVTTRYPWGNDPEDGAGWGNVFDAATRRRIPAMNWTAFGWDDGFRASAPVGRFRANAWGFHDMLGNAWEWCVDGHEDRAYEGIPEGVLDPVSGPGERHTLRGGGYGNAPRGSGIPYRFGMNPHDRFDANGFRVARSL